LKISISYDRTVFQEEESMRVEVQKWGEGIAVCIPPQLAEESHLSAGSVVELTLSEGKIIATPVNGENETLEQLLSKVTDENLHGEIDFGPPIGREIL
jgi:antitoxin MazE